LLTELAAGNELAFTQVYKRYWQRLYVVAYRRLGSRAPAEDVVHEVFASLWKNRENAGIRSLYAYLSAATRYAIFNELAKYEKHITAPQARNRKTDALRAEALHDQVIDYRFLQQMIEHEINQLPGKCRLVFRYSRQEGLSNKEIAHQMAISEKAVEKHITKAINLLRLQLRHLFHLFLL
jgi:RNA polymerase sigma-70 factor (family 1)